MSDLLFTQEMLPRFSEIDPKQMPEQVRKLLNSNREQITQLLAQPGPFTWGNLQQPLENLQDELSKTWSPIGHLHAVAESEELRKAYNDILPDLTEYHTELSQNIALYQATEQIAAHPDFTHLHPAQQKIIGNDLRDFKLAGVQLSSEKKARMAELQQALSLATTKFSENILDATQGWYLPIADKAELEGLPEQSVQLAKEQAESRKLSGYALTLDYPSYSAALKFLRNRELRKTLYEAHVTRASECGPNGGKWDNSPVMETILKIRQEMANLVGYRSYAEYSLVTKMAHSSQEVLAFLHDLVRRSKPMAEKELQELTDFARKLDGITTLEVWDIPYYSDKLRVAEFDFSQEDLRPYFPADQVLNGMFAFVNKLYGITIKKQTAIDVWHPDVSFFTVHDAQGHLRGGFYTDLYARQHKREGAWMDDCRIRRRLNGNGIQQPVAYLTCNFMPPVNNQPALLTHDDVLTVFHEFGHCLHHLLTLVDYPSVAGINGVPWDAVEFPSQFMENFCWEKESLALIATHYQTKAPLPDDLHRKMVRAKNFQTAMQMLRQLEFALFDLRLHAEYDPSKSGQIQTILNDVRKDASVISTPAYNRFQHSFAHIFAGGYAAGYYSYKWAEVLSADAYGMFMENGILDKTTGQSFMQNILEVGGVRDPMDSFIAFRGRKPQIDALLSLSGITT